MPQSTVLVVEDDHAIRQGVVDALAFAGYATLSCADGAEGERMALGCAYDLLLLDLALPGADGLEILARLRAARPQAAVIVITARGSEEERVRGLSLGADDYVVKPFGVRELLARAEAVLRRSPGRPLDLGTIRFPGGTADLQTMAVTLGGESRPALSEREAEVLRFLAVNRGRPVSREELLAAVWHIDGRGTETRTIDMHVARLREKLGDDPAAPTVILTVRGKGYMFTEKER